MARRNSFDDDDYGGFGSSSERSSVAIRRIEESSANSLRLLNELETMSYRMGRDMTQELELQALELQAEKLDHVERKLDEIHVDLDKSKRNLRLNKSPFRFGGIANYFSKRKEGKEVTEPKPPPKPSNPITRTKPKTSANQYSSSGSKVVDGNLDDGNLDELRQQLDRLMGVGDDSEVQVEHITRDIKKRI